MKAIQNCNFNVMAIKSHDRVYFTNQIAVKDKLVDAERITRLHTISKNVFCVAAGYNPDINNIIRRIRYEAVNYKNDYGYEAPVDVIALKVADIFQLNTQRASESVRPSAVTLIIFGIDKHDGPLIYRVDPSGYYVGMKAAVAGSKEYDGTAKLEEYYKNKKETPNYEDAEYCCTSNLLYIQGGEATTADFEMGYVDANGLHMYNDAEQMQAMERAHNRSDV